MPTFWSPQRVAQSKERIADGRSRSVGLGPFDLTPGLPVFLGEDLGEDLDECRTAARQTLALHAGLPFFQEIGATARSSRRRGGWRRETAGRRWARSRPSPPDVHRRPGRRLRSSAADGHDHPCRVSSTVVRGPTLGGIGRAARRTANRGGPNGTARRRARTRVPAARRQGRAPAPGAGDARTGR
ncbi:MAG: hypothetical protein ABS80_05570 [Pseudonocardia sp. SCN 72-51]|nr:MAG: hypothetical protein ABS80_05570 [Pseudonocardia sp. SCN 72-51]